MLIPNQILIIKWNWKIRDHYERLGYTFTKYKDEFEVPAEDLTKGSNYRVDVQCDYCNETFNTPYCHYIIGLKLIQKSCCSNTECMKIKREESLMKTYGV